MPKKSLSQKISVISYVQVAQKLMCIRQFLEFLILNRLNNFILVRTKKLRQNYKNKVMIKKITKSSDSILCSSVIGNVQRGDKLSGCQICILYIQLQLYIAWIGVSTKIRKNTAKMVINTTCNILHEYKNIKVRVECFLCV